MLPAILTLVLLFTSLARSEGIRIPLVQRDQFLTQANGAVDLNALRASTTRLTTKYNHNRRNLVAHGLAPVGSRLLSRGFVALEPIPAAWAGNVTIGTPPQSFLIDFDTGSADFTVPDSTCSSTNCGVKARYNVAASTSAARTSQFVTSSFADGSASSGTVIIDRVTAGGIIARDQRIISASSLSSSVKSLQCDGIMGMAYTALSSSNSPSIFNAGLGYVFALALSHIAGVSELAIGTISRSKSTGPFHYYPVVHSPGWSIKTYWQLGNTAPLVNGLFTLPSRVTSIIDSGTTLIIAPPASAATFYSKIPGAALLAGSANYYTFPCANIPKVTFIFGRSRYVQFPVATRDFNLGFVGSDRTKCVGAIVALDLGVGTSWILGDSFLKSQYTVFNMAYNQIGFAKARY